MATRGIAMTIQYVAWDTSNNVGKTGDASNHTLRWIKDGTASAPTNSPSEVDSTNCPGVYKIQLTSSETDCNIGTLAGKSSSSGVVILPVTIQFERLPDAAPGASGGVPVIGSAPLTNLDATVSSRLASSDSRLNYLDAAVSSRADGTAYTSARAAKLDNLDTTVSSRLAASSYTVPDNAGISAIKSQTDKLTFNESNAVYAYGAGGASAAEIWSYSSRTLTDKSSFSLTSAYDAAKTAASQESVDELAAKIGEGTAINVISPLNPESLQLTLVRGDDYAAADERAVEWSSSDWPNLTNATVIFSAVPAKKSVSGKWSTTATVVHPGETTQTVRVELTATQTASLDVGPNAYLYDIEATLANGHRVTLAAGKITVKPDMTWHTS